MSYWGAGAGAREIVCNFLGAGPPLSPPHKTGIKKQAKQETLDLFYVVEITGLEPVTYALRTHRSTS